MHERLRPFAVVVGSLHLKVPPAKEAAIHFRPIRRLDEDIRHLHNEPPRNKNAK